MKNSRLYTKYVVTFVNFVSRVKQSGHIAGHI